MRFLCLPGMGTNAQILESQLSSIVGQLSGKHDFTYISGEQDSPPGEGIEKFFSGPYFSFWTVPSPVQIGAAVSLIDEVIDEEGPFDGLLGYSQGGGIAATYLIQDAQRQIPRHPFKCAMFIHAAAPFDPHARPFKIRNGRCYWATEDDKIGFEPGSEYPEVWDPRYKCVEVFDAAPEICQRYTCSSESRINIPTLHIVGQADDLYYAQSCHLVGLCDPQHRSVVKHRGDHMIPKDRLTTSKITHGTESLLQMASVG